MFADYPLHADELPLKGNDHKPARIFRSTLLMDKKGKGDKPATTPEFERVVKRLLETKPLRFDKVKVDKKKPGKIIEKQGSGHASGKSQNGNLIGHKHLPVTASALPACPVSGY